MVNIFYQSFGWISEELRPLDVKNVKTVKCGGLLLKISKHMDAIKCERFSKFGRRWLRCEGRPSRAPKIRPFPVLR
jgi:hypothetical protein